MTKLPFSGFELSWKIQISKRHHIMVYIWPDHESILQVEGEPKTGFLNGCCDTGSWQISYVKKRMIYRSYSCFARIHLVRDEVCGRLVAHEIMHLTTYWTKYNFFNIDRDDELIAWFNGEVTDKFWNEFWKHYQDNIDKTTRYSKLEA